MITTNSGSGLAASFDYGRVAVEGEMMYNFSTQQIMSYQSGDWYPVLLQEQDTPYVPLDFNEIEAVRAMILREQQLADRRAQYPALDEAYTVAEAMDAMLG